MRLRSGLVLIASLAALPAIAAPRHHPAKEQPAPAVQRLGTFDAWSAVSRQAGGQTICYAFAYPRSSTPTVAGRGKPALTVTQRTTVRDATAFGAGFTYPADAAASLVVDQATLAFDPSGRFAFARDGAAAIAALRKGHEAAMHSPGPRGVQVVDTFDLKGFDQAYDAIVKACPTK